MNQYMQRGEAGECEASLAERELADIYANRASIPHSIRNDAVLMQSHALAFLNSWVGWRLLVVGNVGYPRDDWKAALLNCRVGPEYSGSAEGKHGTPCRVTHVSRQDSAAFLGCKAMSN